MGKFYVEKKKKYEKVMAKPETIDFLLNYSKSLKINDIKGVKFESNMNWSFIDTREKPLLLL